MALQVWLPLTKDLSNQGLNNMTFSSDAGSNIILDNNGKIGKCYSRPSKQTSGKITSNSTINLSEDISMACWALVSDCVGNTANGLISNHSNVDKTGVGITVKQISTSDYRISCSTGTGSDRTFYTYYGTTNIKDAWHHLALTYSKSAEQLILYVDGNAEYTLNNYINSSIEDYIKIFEWSTTYDSGIYRPAAKLNDVRIYDNCLSPKEVKEISKGLVLHYPLNDAYMQNTTNLNKSIGTSWGHWGTNTITSNSFISPEGTLGSYVNCSSFTDGGVSVTHSSFSVKPDTTYVISAKMKLTGYTYKNLFYWREYNSSKTQLSESGKWSSTNVLEYGHGYKLYYGIVTTSSETSSVQLQSYFYGVGEHWIYDIQVEEGQYPTPFAGYNTSRIATTVYDCSGYQNNGTISGSLSCSNDSPRYKTSTISIDESSFSKILCSNLNLPNGQTTLSFWSKPTNKNEEDSSKIEITYSKNKYFTYINYQYFIHDGDYKYKWKNYWSDGNWHFVTCLFDGTNTKIYIDGNNISPNTDSDTSTAKTQLDDLTLLIRGNSLSDFRVYATALSEEDIKELYNTSCIINS